MTKALASFFLVFTASILLFGGPAHAIENWKIVPNKEVCMVTNMHFSRLQIPVEQSGKTYYGCCENCKATIKNDASSRLATDPQTQKSIDKSKAVIAANEAGSVLYFENRANFEKYVSTLAGMEK
ncbi:MAG: hypothetical protein SGJ18_03315 [Pseudomonadota bacterium]|nr:hypothetical protein [Pseudomonadota bacterium]